MIPVAAVLVVSEDDQHVVPLRAGPQPFQHLVHVNVAAHQVGVRRVLRVAPCRLVETHRGQRAGGDIFQEILAVFQVQGAIGRSRREARKEIERLMVRLEHRAVALAHVNDRPLCVRRPASVSQCLVPAARIPCPGNAFGRQRVAYRPGRLRWNRLAVTGGALRVGEIQRSARGRRHAAGLIRRLRGVDRIAIRWRDLAATGAE